MKTLDTRWDPWVEHRRSSMKADPSPLRIRDVAFGGIHHVMRPLQAGDEDRLREFFASHTPETIHERYGWPVPAMDFARASQLVNVDQLKDCALGIFARMPAGEVLHAVGRYCLDPDGQSAEVAFVVRESRRHLGMATALLRALIQTARGRALRSLWAQVSARNTPMVAIFHEAGFDFAPLDSAGEIKATLPLAVLDEDRR